MGFLFSRPDPPAPLLPEPWRGVDFRDKTAALERINNYQPPNERLRLRILLLGPVGAGKSSFINSVRSVLTGEMCLPAPVANMTNCCTRKLTTYEIPRDEAFYPFVLNDMMGLQQRSRRNRRNHLKDVKRLLKGNIRDEYVFNPESKISKEDRFYNEAPTLSDRVHIVVFVIDANTQHLMNHDVLETLSDIREEISEMEIPQVAIFTKVDNVCPEIKTELKNVFRSVVLKEKMEEFSTKVGIPMNCIFPVKNYHEETNLNTETDILILNTLSRIIDHGLLFLNKLVRNQEGAMNYG